ncbi:hypothetical protein MKW98_024247 [Papaver atlanticum]|uniref:Uncharacterized protein n=1 Tax=Papaver atlanticum TaxID=357466 RepID=A0AAD4SZW8_9MAGN|nr:hypothetical protein MKW98_024247 [Papaver atlanticum]
MAISVFLKAFTRRAQLPGSLSSYESISSLTILGFIQKPCFVFRNVNYPWTSSPLSTQYRSLGSRAYCSKADHSDPVAQSNLTKVVFKYVCANDESQEDSGPIKPIIRKVLEIPSGHTLFEHRSGDDVGYCNLSDFLQSYLMRLKEASELASGQRVSEICFVEASLFKERIRSIMDSAADAFNVNCMIDNSEKTKASFPNGKNSRCGLKLEIDPDDLFKVRVWEMITGGDKHVLDIIVSELRRNGFDFTEDPVTLQKIGEAVERAMTRMTNGIKLHLPVPAGKPDMSASISWGKYAGPPALEIFSVAPSKVAVRLERHPLGCSCSK